MDLVQEIKEEVENEVNNYSENIFDTVMDESKEIIENKEINEEVKDYVKVTPGTRECFYLDKDGEICVVEPIIVPEKNFVYIYDIAKGDSPFVEGIKLRYLRSIPNIRF